MYDYFHIGSNLTWLITHFWSRSIDHARKTQRAEGVLSFETFLAQIVLRDCFSERCIKYELNSPININ